MKIFRVDSLLRIFFFMQVTTLTVLSMNTRAEPRPTPEQYWGKTDLHMDDLKLIINPLNCIDDPGAFTACMSALEYLLRVTEPKSRLIAWPETSGSWKLLRSFGPVVVAERILEETADKSSSEQSVSQVYRKTLDEEKEQADRFWKIYSILRPEYGEIPPPFNILRIVSDLTLRLSTRKDAAQLTAIAINKYLSGAEDPHTHIDPIQKNEDEAQGSGEVSFFGIGLPLQLVHGRMVASAPLEGGPAMKAGVKANDTILEINGVDVSGKSLDEGISLIRGPKGTPVAITLLRGENRIIISIVRDEIVVPNVTSKILTDGGIPLGYIRLASFINRAGCQQISKAIVSLEKAGVKGLLLDLRENGGGLLDQGLCIGGLFVGKKAIVSVKSLEDGDVEEKVSKQTKVTDLPMITLIDDGSASASEILAGALQDYQRSWIAGDRSFGKATVQEPRPFILPVRGEIAGVQKYTTIERFYQPSGRTNQIVGIQPDFPIDPKPNATDDDRFAVREGDLFSNALPALSAPWTQSRPEAATRIQKCANERGVALKTYSSRLNDLIPPDYRLLVAEDLLICAL